MAENDSAADKSFEASPERIRQARQEGNVPQSPELLTLARYSGVLVGAVGVSGLMAHQMGVSLVGFFNSPLEAAGMMMKGASVLETFGTSTLFFIGVIGISMVLTIVALLAQQAITFSPSKLKPKFERLSPMKNAKNKYGPVGLIDFGKAMVKVTAVVTVGVFIGIAKLPALLAAVGSPAALMAPEMARLTVEMLIAAVILAAVAATIDVPVKWGQHRKNLRMTRQEMIDEAKSIEGDPTQKSARQAKAREIANNRQLADVPTADVVIVNPEHYAVALKWNRHANEVPVCVAKGIDHMALQIRERAEGADVPIYRDVPTARSLYAIVDVGEEIRRDHYEAVAAAIRFADNIKAKKE
ncbi:MAG: flagellar type III secretion system protein FlhB [Pseudomonadota bacterium]